MNSHAHACSLFIMKAADLFIFTVSMHPLSKVFFCVSLASFFPFHAFRSPTNELNTEETWKPLDETWLLEQRDDEDIVAYDYSRFLQQKQASRRIHVFKAQSDFARAEMCAEANIYGR